MDRATYLLMQMQKLCCIVGETLAEDEQMQQNHKCKIYNLHGDELVPEVPAPVHAQAANLLTLAINGTTVTISGDTHAVCMQTGQQILAAMSGQSISQQIETLPHLTYEDWLHQFYNLYYRDNSRLKSRYVKHVYEYLFKYIAPALGGHVLNKLDGTQIQHYLNAVIQDNTRHKLGGLIRRSLEKAVALDKIEKSPYRAVEIATPSPEHYRALEFDEQCKIISEEYNPKYRDVFFVLCATGMRVNELCALNFACDIDCENLVLHVITSRDIDSGKLTTTKTKKSKRDIYFAPDLIPYLQRLSNCKQLTYNGIHMHFDRLYAHLNIYGANIHSLRHTFMSTAYYAGMSVKTIQTLAGHAQMSTTMDIYVHSLRRGSSPLLDYLRGLTAQLEG